MIVVSSIAPAAKRRRNRRIVSLLTYSAGIFAAALVFFDIVSK